MPALSGFINRVGANRFVRLFATSGAMTLIRLAGAVLGMGASVILARMLGADSVGYFFVALSAVSVVAVLCGLGYPSISVRFLSRYQAKRRQDYSAAFKRHSLRETLLVSGAAAGLGSILSLVAVPGELGQLLTIGFWIVPPIAVMRVNGMLALANRRNVMAYAPDTFGRPLFLFAGLLLAILLTPQISSVIAIAIAVVTTWGLALYQAFSLADLRRGGAEPGSKVTARLRRQWLSAGLPLLPSVVIAGLFADAALLATSPFLTPEDVAILGVCLRLTFLAGFAIQVVSQIALPDLADSLASNDVAASGRNIRYVLITSGLIAAAVILFVILFGDILLGLFGPEFEKGYPILAALALVQALRVPGLLSVQLLTLSGRQIQVSGVMVAVAVVLFCTSILAVPPFGLPGAVFSVTLSVFVLSLASSVLAWRIFAERMRRASQVREQPAGVGGVAAKASV